MKSSFSRDTERTEFIVSLSFEFQDWWKLFRAITTTVKRVVLTIYLSPRLTRCHRGPEAAPCPFPSCRKRWRRCISTKTRAESQTEQPVSFYPPYGLNIQTPSCLLTEMNWPLTSEWTPLFLTCFIVIVVSCTSLASKLGFKHLFCYCNLWILFLEHVPWFSGAKRRLPEQIYTSWIQGRKT